MLTIHTSQTARVARMELEGNLNASTAPLLEAEIKQYLPAIDDLVLELSKLEYVSSAGLRVLIWAQKKLNGRGGVHITGVTGPVLEVLDMTGISQILDVEKAREPQPYKYLRIQGQELAENTMYAKGIFSMCMQLIADDTLNDEDEELYREIDAWFAENLPWPPQCKRQEKVVCWFKTENSEEMLRMIRPALWLLERYNHPYYLVYTNTPGEIVYEDQYQVCVKVPGTLQIDKLQKSWSPED